MIFGISGSAALALAALLYRLNTAAPAPTTTAPPQLTEPAKTIAVEHPRPEPAREPAPKQESKAETKKQPKQDPAPDRKPTPAPREVAKSEPPHQQQPEPVRVKEPEPTPIAPPPEPAAPAGKYFGPPEGRFTWAGSLAGGQNLVINASNAAPGALQGRGLPPSLEVSVTVDPPAIQVLGQPSASNGYRLTLKNSSSSEVQSIVIRWREHKK